ncbi:hypothetical protein [Enterobacter bugandensis]|uniref:hypothetical protein n=1 Tax=Enterobacter bugandensis TaxID=881260 RepID=UPI0034D183EA|nr:hypothetical protein [Enterobacter bugandensis]
MKSGFEDQIPPVGTVLYVIPTHICPTSNLYEYALVSENHEIVDKWYINARNRIINF